MSLRISNGESLSRKGLIQHELLKGIRQTGSGLGTVIKDVGWYEGPEWERGDYLSKVVEVFEDLVKKGFIEEV